MISGARATPRANPAQLLVTDGEQPKTLDAWLMLKQAELMLGHLIEAPAQWPQNAIYCHSCITALRSITFLMQKALAGESGFPDWYAGVQERLAADPELQYLKHARNYVLKQGSLRMLGSYEVRGGSGWLPGMTMRGIGPAGPDLWAPDPTDPEKEIPVDWRRLPGFEFLTHLRFGELEGLPEPPDKEVKALLAEKIQIFESILREADDLFDPHGWDDGDDGLTT
jgi:hypothetical protein